MGNERTHSTNLNDDNGTSSSQAVFEEYIRFACNENNINLCNKMSQLATRCLTAFRKQLLSSARTPLRISTANRSTPTYEHDGKTIVSILNKELDLGLMINNYSQVGFRLNNGMVIVGPMAIFPRSVLSWNVSNMQEITEESLSLFYTLEPRIDILVIGVGDQKVTPEFSRKIIQFMRKHKINVEVLGTEQACATFNFLNAESRLVAAAIIPPLHIKINENDLLQTKLRHRELYNVNDM